MDVINTTFADVDPFLDQHNGDINFEEETSKEYDELSEKFKARAKDESDKKKQNTSTEYWFCAYFANQFQRDEFLKKIGALNDLIDQYIPGDVLAEKLGVDIPYQEITIPKSFRVNKDIVSLSETFSID